MEKRRTVQLGQLISTLFDQADADASDAAQSAAAATVDLLISSHNYAALRDLMSGEEMLATSPTAPARPTNHRPVRRSSRAVASAGRLAA